MPKITVKRLKKVTCEKCSIVVYRKQRGDAKYRFCSPKCALSEAVEKSKLSDRAREKNSFWHGGIRYALGYRYLLRPEHPLASKSGYVQEHRLVMEENIGRHLGKEERIHHKNGDKLDNRIGNLELCSNQSEHMKHHRSFGKIGREAWEKMCVAGECEICEKSFIKNSPAAKFCHTCRCKYGWRIYSWGKNRLLCQP